MDMLDDIIKKKQALPATYKIIPQFILQCKIRTLNRAKKNAYRLRKSNCRSKQ